MSDTTTEQQQPHQWEDIPGFTPGTKRRCTACGVKQYPTISAGIGPCPGPEPAATVELAPSHYDRSMSEMDAGRR